jgi:mono/diheme cytochrome c family protein
MKPWLTTLLLLPLLLAPLANAQANSLKKPSADPRVARGEYIVEDLVRCAQCHTPMDENGKRDASRALMGGPLQLRPTYPSPNWALRAPRIAGRPPGTDDDFIKLMMTGIARTGHQPDPPMPTFHMTRDDAESVLAYLKSLNK